jgi:hypothetical protein
MKTSKANIMWTAVKEQDYVDIRIVGLSGIHYYFDSIRGAIRSLEILSGELGDSLRIVLRVRVPRLTEITPVNGGFRADRTFEPSIVLLEDVYRPS